MRMIAGAPAEIRSGFGMQMNDYRVTRLKTCKTRMQTAAIKEGERVATGIDTLTSGSPELYGAWCYEKMRH
jgi:deoxycytidylate deaminase